MANDAEAGDGLLDRSDMEIALAGFALTLARRGENPGRPAGVRQWVEREAAALVASVLPRHRMWTRERVQQLARSRVGVEVSVAGVACGVDCGDESATRYSHLQPWAPLRR